MEKKFQYKRQNDVWILARRSISVVYAVYWNKCGLVSGRHLPHYWSAAKEGVVAAAAVAVDT